MSVTAFGSPVFVKRGSNLVQEIVDLAGAIEFLEEWRENGRKPMGVARDAFVGFAKRTGILEVPEAVMPWIAASNSGGGQVQV